MNIVLQKLSVSVCVCVCVREREREHWIEVGVNFEDIIVVKHACN